MGTGRGRLLGAVALSAAAVLAAGCGGGGAGNTKGSGSSTGKGPAFSTKVSGTMKAWGFDNTDEVGSSRLDYANKQLSGVKVTLDKTPFDAQKFSAKVAGGSVPDVVQMDASLVATYAARNLIVPLDQCYAAHKVVPEQKFYPSVTNDITYQNKIWAVPQFYQPPAIILNKRVMKQAGVTADQINTSKPDQLIAAAKKMYKASGGNPTRLGFDPVATGQPALWILGYGGQLIDNSGRPTMNDPRNVKGLQVLKRITDAQGGFAKVKSFSDSFDVFGDNNQFVKDQVGAQVNAQWYVNVLTPYVKKVDIGAVPFYGQDGKPFTEASGTAFVIPSSAKNKDAACAWALDLVSLPAWEAAGAARQQTVEKTPGAINTGLFTGSPEADKVIRQKYVKKSGNAGFDQTIDTYYSIVASGKSIGASPAGEEIKSQLTTVVTDVLLGRKQPMAALTQAQDAAMRAYNKATR